MSGRTEMSTTLQDPNLEPTRSTSTTIALIGPNAAHRSVMVKALSGAEARNVREFIDYPASLADIPNLMEEHFDVVMIDVDSDQSYALQIVESIAAFNTAIVMVYSMRNDPDLLRDCMRAGARDFLPLPEDVSDAPAEAEVAAIPPPPVISAPSPVHPEETEVLDPKDFLLPEPVAPEFILDAPPAPVAPAAPTAPEPGGYSAPAYDYSSKARRPDLQPFSQSAETPKAASHPEIQPDELRRANGKPHPGEPQPSGDPQSTDFSAWDSLWIRTAQAPAGKSSEVSPEPTPAAEPAPAKKRITPPSGPQLVARAAAPVESASAAAAPLFRQVDASDPAKPQRPWVRWALLAGVPLVVVGLIMLVFMPSSRQNAPAPSTAQASVPPTESAAPSSSAAPTEAKPIAKPSPAALATPETGAQTTPVASDMMNAQLSAPSRISGAMKKPSSVEEAPASFAPGAIETSEAVPGQIFGSQNNLKVVPGVSAISAGVAEGMLIRKTAPIYPEFAKAARVSGTIMLGANISKTGAIEGLHVISGPAILRGPAMDAVKTWRYRPYMLNNQPVEVQTTIRVIFSLDQR
ncbi:MAG: energy transducer TonB [Terracidiphilus sp.]